MTATIHIMIMLLCIDKANANSYMQALDGDGNCAPGYVPLTDATTCEELDWSQFGMTDGSFFNAGSWPSYPPGCYYKASTGKGFFNAHPTGAFPDDERLIVCEGSSPTPAPRAPGMSGDPIVNVNGFRVKFDLPIGKSTLMWKDDLIALFAKADLLSADKHSQWFSEFMLCVKGEKRAVIERREVHPGLKSEPDMVNTLSLTISDSAGLATRVEKVGYHSSFNEGQVDIAVQPLNRTVGGLRSEAVQVKSDLFDFRVVAEVAKKFGSRSEAMKYVHLDITMRRMRSGAKAGLFAEIYGFLPMSADTATMIKRVTRE